MDRLRTTLHGIAVFEALKGLAALAAVTGLLSLLHHDLHHLALELIGHFDLDPSRHFPSLLLETVDRLNATPVRSLVLVAGAYIATRWIEAWGLWNDRAWGEWLGALGGALYIPFEIRHVMHKAAWPGVLVLLFNVALVIILLARLRQRGRRSVAAAG